MNAIDFNQDISDWDFSGLTVNGATNSNVLKGFMLGKTNLDYTISYYDNLLIKWAKDESEGGLPNNELNLGTINMGSIQYTSNGVIPRQSILDNKNISSIIDGGLVQTVESWNTVIGGVAKSTTLNTASKLSTRLNISETSITDFVIEGDDIKCNINSDYEILSNAFINSNFTNSSPTFYFDLEGKCKKLNFHAFKYSLNTVRFYFPEVLQISGGEQFYHGNFDYSNDNLLPIRYIYMPKLNVLGDNLNLDENQFGDTPRPTTFYCNSSLETAYLGSLPDFDIIYAIENDVSIFYTNTNNPGYLLTVEELDQLHPDTEVPSDPSVDNTDITTDNTNITI
jgi:hypothetical protein